MNRETLLTGDSDHREDEDPVLRPQRMRDMVGQRDVFERLEIAI